MAFQGLDLGFQGVSFSLKISKNMTHPPVQGGQRVLPLRAHRLALRVQARKVVRGRLQPGAQRGGRARLRLEARAPGARRPGRPARPAAAAELLTTSQGARAAF